MTTATARKRFWADWHKFKSNPNEKEVGNYVNRMKSDLGYNDVIQFEVERKMLMEITRLHS